jgi:hypothetical protein
MILPSRSVLTLALNLVTYAALGLFASAGGRASVIGSDETSVEELVKRLGHEDFQVRERAMRELSLREDAFPAVRRALESPDAEVRRRAAVILEALEVLKKHRLLERTAARAKDGDVDEFVERWVRWGDQDQENLGGEAAVQLIDKLIELDGQHYKREILGWRLFLRPLGSYANYLKTAKPKMLTFPQVRLDWGGPSVIRSEQVTVVDRLIIHGTSLVFSTGSVQIPDGFSGVVFAGGPVAVTRRLGAVVIVCDGDCRLGENYADHSLVIARGDIHCPAKTSHCTLIAGGKVRLPDDEKVVWNIIRENEPNAFGFVRFFDPARIGLVTDPAATDVRLKEVRQGTPFAAAGLRAGDVVLAVGGKETAEREVFRRALRRALAEGEVTFKVRRDGKTVELTAVPKD